MSDLGEEIDDYLEVFFSGSSRGEASVEARTSERDLNVPVPTLPGYLGTFAPGGRVVAPSGQVRAGSSYVAAPRAAPPPPLMFTTSAPPAAKAAGGSPPPPSPVMSASPPPPPDAPATAPAPNTPTTARIVTNYVSAPPPVPTNCPPCSCPGGVSTGSILALIAAAGVGWYLLTERTR